MLVRWNPWRPARFFDDFMSAFPTFEAREGGEMSMAVDVKEEEDRYLVKADVPGFSAEAIDVQFAEGMLTLTGKRDQTKEEKRGEYLYRERSAGSFRRTLQLATDVDASTIKADYRDGVLTVELPKKPEVKPKKITVKAS